jgi:hypothetical protein
MPTLDELIGAITETLMAATTNVSSDADTLIAYGVRMTRTP